MTLVGERAKNKAALGMGPPSVEHARRVQASLALKLALYSALVVVVTSAALSLAAYSYARDALRSRIADRLELVLTDRRQALLSYLAHQRQLAAMVANRIYLKELITNRESDKDPEFVVAAQRILDDSLQSVLNLVEISVANPLGQIITSTNSAAIGTDVSRQPVFVAGRAAARIGRPRMVGSTVELPLAVPMLAETGDLLAVLLVELDISPLKEILQNEIGLGETGDLLVALHAGQNAHYLFPSRAGQRTSVPLAEVPAMRKALAGQSGMSSGDYAGEAVLAVFGPVEIQDQDEPWGMVAKIDRREAFAPIAQFRNMFLALQIVLLVGGVAASYAVARRLTRPIAALTIQAAAVAEGDLTGRIGHLAGDELGALGAAFNRMTDRLNESWAQLEQRVSERTDELAGANRELAFEIAARRGIEEALKTGERRIRTILEAAHEAFVGIDVEGVITDWNHQAELTFGWSREEAIGHAMPELIMPERFREEHRQGLARFLATGEAPVLNQRLELPALHRDGHEFVVEVTISAMRSGTEYLFGAFMHDISQRKEAERLLRESEERFRLLVAGVQDYAILRLDAAGRVLSWNPGAERIHGYTAQEIIGQHFSKFYLPADVATREPEQELETAQREGRFADENLRVRKDGSSFWARVVITPLFGEQGELRGFAKIEQDITERKAAEDALKRTAAELARSNSDLEQFAYVASHDLQEPLRAVAGYCQLLQRRYQGKFDPAADEFLGYAVDGAVRMQTLITDLLAYSRVTTRSKPLEPTDCNAVFAQAVDNLKTMIADNEAEVTRGELPTILADRSQLGQLLQNLISNAVKFHGPAAPRVRVEAKREHDYWLFSVADNGIGIEPQFLEKIFVIFQRLHTRSEYPGTGIGLAICQKIVERHGGRIWVDSRPGRGSTFFFTLPVEGPATEGEGTA